jgi:ribosomal protein L37AE/L43A
LDLFLTLIDKKNDMSEPCTKCGKNLPIVNRTKWLCNDCNFARLHNGATRASIYRENALKRVESKAPRKVRTKFKPLPQQKASEAEIKHKLSILKKEIEVEAIQNNMYYCWGCGRATGFCGGLDKSHILSVGQRKDLELDKTNMNLFCRDCHTKWESWNIDKMIMLHSFEKDFNYIKEKDWRVYNKILKMIEDRSMELFDQILDDKESVPKDLFDKMSYFSEKYNYVVHVV